MYINMYATTHAICIKSLSEIGFRPRVQLLFDFVPLSGTKPLIWISSRNPCFSELGLILVDGFDTRLIPRSFECGVVMMEQCCKLYVYQYKCILLTVECVMSQCDIRHDIWGGYD